MLTVDESSVFQPPSQLQVPEDAPVSNSDSALSAPDSDDNSSEDNSSVGSPRYADEPSVAEQQLQPVEAGITDVPNVIDPRQKVRTFCQLYKDELLSYLLTVLRLFVMAMQLLLVTRNTSFVNHFTS